MNRRTGAQIGIVLLLPSLALPGSGCGIRRALAAREGRRAGLLRRLSRLETGSSVSMASAEIAGLKVSIWRSPTATGPAPLIVFSHGFGGMSTQSRFLMRALSEAGYLVVAPNHKDARPITASGRAERQPPEEKFGDPSAWSDQTYKDRADDITHLLHAMKADLAWSKSVDWSKVALAGHSLGGYTVLGLAGAWPSWTLKEVPIKAVLALSPYCTPFTTKRTLGSLKTPVMYQGGTRDFGVTPNVSRAGGAYDQTASPAEFVEYNGAGHFAWTDLNPTYQASINSYSIAFFDKYVRGIATADPTQKRADVSDLRSK